MKPAPNKHIRTSGAKCFQLLEDKRNNFVSLPPRTVPRLRQYAGTLAASVGRQCVKTTFDLHFNGSLKNYISN